MWLGKEVFLGFSAKVEKIVQTITIIKTFIQITLKETQQLTNQVKHLADTVTELGLKLDALHVKHARPEIPTPAAPVPQAFQVPNLFEELPIGSEHGFTFEELHLDTGYKENV